MVEQKIVTHKTPSGDWDASYEGGTVHGKGKSEESARKNLQDLFAQSQANLGNTATPPAGTIGATQEPGPTVNHSIQAVADRLIVKALPKPTLIGEKVVKFACYRASDPATQSYGETEQESRVNFLTDDQNRRSQK